MFLARDNGQGMFSGGMACRACFRARDDDGVGIVFERMTGRASFFAPDGVALELVSRHK